MRPVTCNGNMVLGLRLRAPVVGAWTAELEVDAEDPITGSVTLAQDALSFKGTALRSGVVAGVCRLEMVGGAGGLWKENGVLASSYQGATARTIVTDLLGAVGEQLDTTTSTAAVLNTPVAYWTRAAGKAGPALRLLTDMLGARWRVLPSGLVWVGTETWPAAPDDMEALELDRDDGAGNVHLGPETLALMPGMVLEGRQVGRVEHLITRDEALRTTFWVDDGS